MRPHLWTTAMLILLTIALAAGPLNQVGRSAASSTQAAAPFALPQAEGPAPSYRVAAFYYPWYDTPALTGAWKHWHEPGFAPPDDISSDYYPALGAYSAVDRAVVAQHFAWLRQAGVGVIITSWWGRGTFEDRAVPLLLDVAEEYGIKVAFHIEPYGGRTAERLVEDIVYLYDRYGDQPAFYRTQQASRWSPDSRNKGLFFVWLIEFADPTGPPVEASYWRDAMDAIHALPDGALVIANTTRPDWVDGGHFDGLYNYVTLRLDQQNGFAWAQGLPPDAWYAPSVAPGFSARRIQYSEDTYLPREDGATYHAQWQAALGTGVEPQMVTITSFNEWHEGTQIEPIAVGKENGRGYTYADYGTLPPDGYLTLTREWVERFLSLSWPTATPIRFRIVTTSDWTTFGLVAGAQWMHPTIVSASAEATSATLENGRYLLAQPLDRAQAGQPVEMVVDVMLGGLESAETLTFEIERGHVGVTTVTLYSLQSSEPVMLQRWVWDGIAGNARNSRAFQMSAQEIVS